jgi:hypothetical protein
VLAVAAAIVSFTADSITPNHVLEQVIAIGGALAVLPAGGRRGDRLRQQVA